MRPGKFPYPSPEDYDGLMTRSLREYKARNNEWRGRGWISYYERQSM
jgi:hypothetical protein